MHYFIWFFQGGQIFLCLQFGKAGNQEFDDVRQNNQTYFGSPKYVSDIETSLETDKGHILLFLCDRWGNRVLKSLAQSHTVKVKFSQSCPTLCNLMDCIVPGILQARILEWVAFSFSRGSSQPRNRTGVSCIAGGFFTNWGWPGIKPVPPAVEAQSLNPWTTREGLREDFSVEILGFL